MYCPASSGPIHGEKTCRKKSQPKKAIENGLTSQLTKSVTRSPRGLRPTLRIDRRSILSIIG